MTNKEEDSLIKCDRCHGQIIRKWNRAEKSWSSINEINYWSMEKGQVNLVNKKFKYRWLCRPCFLEWYEKDRENFYQVVPENKRKLFYRYRYNGIFDKVDVIRK